MSLLNSFNTGHAGIICNQSINQFICPETQYTLDWTPREDATSTNRCPLKQC